MIATDESALICDFAETYHVLDYTELPVELAATLAAGLRPDARVNMKIAGAKETTEHLLLAMMTDYLAWLVWSKTKDGEKGRRQPKSVFEIMTGEKKETEYRTFDTGEDFEREKQRILEALKDVN